jgi:hypothetical protein
VHGLPPVPDSRLGMTDRSSEFTVLIALQTSHLRSPSASLTPHAEPTALPPVRGATARESEEATPDGRGTAGFLGEPRRCHPKPRQSPFPGAPLFASFSLLLPVTPRRAGRLELGKVSSPIRERRKGQELQRTYLPAAYKKEPLDTTSRAPRAR